MYCCKTAIHFILLCTNKFVIIEYKYILNNYKLVMHKQVLAEFSSTKGHVQTMH